MEHARRACSFFLARLRSEIGRLRAIDYPGQHPGPHKWLNLVDGFVDTAENYILKSYGAGIHPDIASVFISDAEVLGNQAYELLEHMAGSDADHIPHQVVAPFQRWVNALGITNTIFFRAEHEANYELWSIEYDIDNINGATDSLRRAGKSIKWPLLRVTVPDQALGMLPHFAVVAHELGHAIEDRIQVEFGKYDVQWQEFINRLVARIGSVSADDILDSKEILSDWITEVKSDALGFHISGPAFFFALAGFLEISGHGYGVSETHPPSETRLRLLTEHLAAGDMSFSDVYRDELGIILEFDMLSPNVLRLPADDILFAELSTAIGAKHAAICVSLIPFVNHIASDIYKSVRRYLRVSRRGQMIYSPAQLELDLQRHLDALCALIPPIEFESNGTRQATSLASILNVGWATLLAKLDNIPPALDGRGDRAASRMERLNELLLKAVELSEARRLWDDHQ